MMYRAIDLTTYLTNFTYVFEMYVKNLLYFCGGLNYNEFNKI